MDSPVVTELALACSDLGFVSLRFNWRGIGASAGVASGEMVDAVTDYRAALLFMEDSVDGAIVACGYSWGALAAARACLDASRVRKLILVAPPPEMLDAPALDERGVPTLVIAGDRDSYVPIPALRAVLDGIDGSKLVILEGVDHFFMNGLAGIGEATRAWLESRSER
jgi:alpha/beta superfamily hydrolase